MSMVLRDIPKLIDEATSGLDPVVREEILDIFNDFTNCFIIKFLRYILCL